MGALSVVVGTVLVLVSLNDVFHTLLHPVGHGRLSRAIGRGSWRVGRVLGTRASTLAGIVGVILSILAWVVLQILGWALVFLPSMPSGFSYSPGLHPAAYPPFSEAITFSLITFSTVGFGGVVAATPVLRLVSPIEALAGFAVLTAALSWFTQLYTALARRRGLALRLAALDRAAPAGMIDRDDAPTSASLLDSVAAEVAKVTVDLEQHGEVYYFRERQQDETLPAMLDRLQRLAAEAAAHPAPSVRRQGAVLDAALRALCATVRRESGPKQADADVASVVAATRRDYGFTEGRAAG